MKGKFADKSIKMGWLLFLRLDKENIYRIWCCVYVTNLARFKNQMDKIQEKNDWILR